MRPPIEQYAAIAAKATPGPWDSKPFAEGKQFEVDIVHIGHKFATVWGHSSKRDKDAAFISSSRAAIPEMADYIKRLEDALIKACEHREEETNESYEYYYCGLCTGFLSGDKDSHAYDYKEIGWPVYEGHAPGCIVGEILEALG